MHRKNLIFLLLAWSALLSHPAYSRRQAGVIPARDRVVVVISLDGFPARAFEDSKLPVPTLRRLAREGALAQKMTVSNPAVTWPNHTTLVTGVPPARHGVLFNGLLVRGDPKSPVRVEPWRDKAELVRVPTVYDLAHKAGLTTAQVDWVAIQNPGTITWEFPERPSPQGAVEREMIAEGILRESDVQEFGKSNPVWRDYYWTEAAVHIIKKHRPNLLLFHLLNVDSTHHRYGPKSWAGYTALAYADARVQEILDALKITGLLDRVTLMIVSDHGFKMTKRSIRPNAALRRQGLLKVENGNVTCDAFVIPEGGTAMAYVTNPENRGRLIPRLKDIFQKVEGVDRILEATDYPALGMPLPEENNQMADLVLVAKEGYGFAASHEGDSVVEVGEGINPGQHGYLSSDPDMDALFIAWGYGIRAGARLGQIDNVDIAPTIAALLGLKMGNVVGKELRKALSLPTVGTN